jgi:RNA polymerase sigma-70 factor (ECF subfamily)
MDSFTAALVPELPRLHAIARRFGPDREDLVQETILRALRFRSGFREGSDLRAWLTRILFNLRAGECRRSQRFARASAAYAAEPAVGRGDPSIPVELTDAGRRIDSRDLALIAHAEVDGYTYAEMSQAMAVPIGTVMSRLHRARRRVADALAQRRSASSKSTMRSPLGTASSRKKPRSSTGAISTRPSGRPMRAAMG